MPKSDDWFKWASKEWGKLPDISNWDEKSGLESEETADEAEQEIRERIEKKKRKEAK